MVSLMKLFKEWKERTLCVFVEYCGTGLFTMKLQLFDLLGEDSDRLRIVRSLEASGFDKINVVHERSYWRPSMWRSQKCKNVFCTGLIIKGLQGEEKYVSSIIEYAMKIKQMELVGEAVRAPARLEG